jgi:Zn-dependent peptidase ImmA (M78 family)
MQSAGPKTEVQRAGGAMVEAVERRIALYPRIAPSRVARVLGVTSIRVGEVRGEGRTRWQRDGAIEIHIREDVKYERMRFTIAHEIGHVLLSKPDGRAIIHDSGYERLEPEREETWCNEFAGRLLVGTDELESYVRDSMGSELSLGELEQLANHFKVSRSVAFIRYSHIRSHQYSLLRFVRRRNLWLMASQVGVNRTMLQRLSTLTETSETINSATAMPTFCRLPLEISGKLCEIPGLISRSQSDCVALVTGLGGSRNSGYPF